MQTAKNAEIYKSTGEHTVVRKGTYNGISAAIKCVYLSKGIPKGDVEREVHTYKHLMQHNTAKHIVRFLGLEETQECTYIALERCECDLATFKNRCGITFEPLSNLSCS